MDGSVPTNTRRLSSFPFFLLFASLIPLITAPFVPGWMQPAAPPFSTTMEPATQNVINIEIERSRSRPSTKLPPLAILCSRLDHWHIWLIFIAALLASRFRCSLDFSCQLLAPTYFAWNQIILVFSRDDVYIRLDCTMSPRV